jgi:uncharacterized RDD family membrane protein YckC
MASGEQALARRDIVEYSGFGRRFCALCVDGPLRLALGLAIVFLPMRFLVLGLTTESGSTDPNYLWNTMPLLDKIFVFAFWLIASMVVPWLYTALQECSARRATLGKRLLGIQVTDLTGARISFGRASGRFFARLLPTFGIGYLMMLFTSKKQALHDLIAGCLVLRTARPSEKVGFYSA